MQTALAYSDFGDDEELQYYDYYTGEYVTIPEPDPWAPHPLYPGFLIVSLIIIPFLVVILPIIIILWLLKELF
jgi:hypothetical protein